MFRWKSAPDLFAVAEKGRTGLTRIMYRHARCATANHALRLGDAIFRSCYGPAVENWGTKASDWTREHVEARLIAAFVTLPGTPIFRRRSRVTHSPGGQGSILTDTLNWCALLDHDPAGRDYLLAWAACKARGDLFSEFCDAKGWARSTAEDGRRRAADTIARSLAAEPIKRLDSRKTGTALSHPGTKLEKIG